jgi:ribosomal protein S18 acetylase RimI-like enzyme
MDYTLVELDAEGFLNVRGQIVGVYQTAFGEPPYFRTAADAYNFSESIPRHVNRRGFRAVAALHNPTGLVIGFAYGYISLPGQWWYDVVSRALSPEVVEVWIHGSYELVELAVRPEHQGHRLGSALHDELLAQATQPRAVLSTMQTDTVALKLYRRRGWVPLIENFQFPGVSRVYQIMGLDLLAHRPRPAL